MTLSHFSDNVTDAQDSYRQLLEESIISHLGFCALRGWTPADLRHEFSADIDPLLFHALPEIAYSCSDEMYTLWVNGTRAAETSHLPVMTLEKILTELPKLSTLPDWAMLAELHALDNQDTSPMTPAQAKAHHRITALLKKAESTNFEEEAEALILKAETLRQQYRIESLLINSYDQDVQARSSTIRASRVYLEAPWIRHQYKLLNAIARVHSSEALLITKSGICTLFGEQDDVAHIIDLFNSLNRQRAHFMKTSAGARIAQLNGETSSYRRSFMISYASQISRLLISAKEDAFNELVGQAPLAHSAIVPVLENRSVRSKEALKETFPNMRTMTFKSTNRRGTIDGFNAANESHLGGESASLEDSTFMF